jgi:mannosylglycerate hydrolase
MNRLKPTYHIVSHTHWDREWYLSFEEFRAMLVTLIDDLFELFERDPEFRCFTLDGQLIVLEDYLRVRPEKTERVKELVAQKKLFIGPWYVLADEFLVSAEASVRNLMIGHRLADQFGGGMKVGYLPDTFSHIAMMPAILRGFGIDNVILWRGFGGESGQESSEYSWKGHDGNTVLMTHLSKLGYSAAYFGERDPVRIEEVTGRVIPELDRRARTSQRLWLNGGDHHWPDPALTYAIQLLRKRNDATYIHSNLVDYTAAQKHEVGELPEITGELRGGFRQAFAVQGGIYSSRMYIKQENAGCQQLLERYIEPLNAINVIEGNRSFLPLVRQAWKTLLQNHPHDSICATSIDSVHEEMMTRFKRVKEIAGAVRRFCLDNLLPYTYNDYRDDTYLYIFNLNPQTGSGVVKATIDFFLKDIPIGINPDVKTGDAKKPVNNFVLVDAQNNEIPFEILDRRKAYGITYSKTDYPHQSLVERFTVEFFVENVPPFGYKGFRILKKKSRKRAISSLRAGKNYIQNNFIRLEVSHRGDLILTDKSTGTTYNKINIFEDTGDIGDEYNFCPPDSDRIILSTRTKPEIRIRKGLRSASIEIGYKLKLPASATDNRKGRSKQTVIQRIRSLAVINHNSRRAEIKTTVTNVARDHRLRVTFSSGVRGNISYADTPFAIVRREHRKYDYRDFPIEVPPSWAPMQRFVTVADERKGMTLITKGLPEYDVPNDNAGTVALTLLRCVGSISWGDLKTRRGGEAGWKNLTPGAQCPGEHTFEYALYPHSAEETKEWTEIIRQADDYLTPMFSVGRKNNSELPLEKGWLEADIPGCILSAFKESEDQSGSVVRWYNASPSRQVTTIRPGFPVKASSYTLLNEETTGPAELGIGGTITTTMEPFALATLKLITRK